MNHNGTDSYIINNTGDLYIRDLNGDIHIQGKDNEESIIAKADGAVELYYNNSLRLSTTANGITLGHNLLLDNATNAGRDVTWDPANDQLQWKDNTKASFGASSDLKIYHDGTNSVIQNTTGELIIYGGNDEIRIQAENTEDSIIARPNGSVDLYHNNVKKFETTSTGFEAHGGQFRFNGAEGGASQLLIYADEGDDANDKWRVMAGGSNDFEIGTLADGSWDTCIKALGDGAVELYHNDTKKLETTSTGLLIDGNIDFADNDKAIFGTGGDLEIFHNGSQNIIGNTTTQLRLITDQLRFRSATGSETYGQANVNGGFELHYDNSKKFETTSYGASLTGTLLASGNIKTVDNGVIAAGTGDDVQLFHDGTNTTLQNNTGVFYLKTINGEFSLVARPNGATELYHDHGKKLETVTGGVTITGTCTATSFAGDGSNLSGIAAFPSGTSMLFQQSSAPTGWTKQTTHNNKALRIVNGNVGTGGGNNFSTAFGSNFSTTGGAVSNHTLSTSQIPAHQHEMRQLAAGLGCGPNISQAGIVGTAACATNNTAAYTFNTGGGSSHNHGLTQPYINLNVKYVDFIIANKD